MTFCILRDQEIIARKKKDDKRGYKIFRQLIFLACLWNSYSIKSIPVKLNYSDVHRE